jgi:hypothetical protein
VHYCPAWSQSVGGDFYYTHFEYTEPEDNRMNYSINLAGVNVQFKVWRMMDTIHTESFSITEAHLDSFKRNIWKCNLTENSKRIIRDCEGTLERFFMLCNRKPWHPFGIWGDVQYCGKKRYGNIKGNVENLILLFKRIIPEFENKMSNLRTIKKT